MNNLFHLVSSVYSQPMWELGRGGTISYINTPSQNPVGLPLLTTMTTTTGRLYVTQLAWWWRRRPKVTGNTERPLLTRWSLRSQGRSGVAVCGNGNYLDPLFPCQHRFYITTQVFSFIRLWKYSCEYFERTRGVNQWHLRAHSAALTPVFLI